MDVQALVFWSRVVAGVLGVVAIVFLTWAGVSWRPGRGRRYCPGVGVRWWKRWSPLRVMKVRVCGYDLSGLPESGGGVRCPECGGEVCVSRRGLRTARSWRPGRAGVAVMVVACTVLCVPMLKTRRWQSLVPTTVLIGVKRVVGTEWMPTRLRRELGKRLDAGGLYGWQERLVIPGLQRDMRADRYRWNATNAVEHLLGMGGRGVEALEDSLGSRDRQERFLAAEELRARCWERTWKGRELVREPSDALLRVSAEELGRNGCYDARGDDVYRAYGFLLQFPERAAPLAERGLYSGEKREMLACAGVVMQLHRTEHYARAAQVLASHLVDNSMRRDAVFAAAILALMKLEAVPFLERLKEQGDKQQREVAGLLLVRLEPGGRGWADARLSRLLETYYWSGEVESGARVSDWRRGE